MALPRCVLSARLGVQISSKEKPMFEDIKLPTELLPKDGRFGCGPSLVRPEFLEAMSSIQKQYVGTSHRKLAVKDRFGSIFSLLRSYLRVPEDYKIAIGIGGATLVWDMITFSLIEKKSAHFINGEFSNKWYKSAQGAGFVDATSISAENGKLPNFSPNADCDVHCITWNETSTGAMFPNTPSCPNSLLAVDATSAAGALNWDLTKTDLFYFSPQKAMGSEGGLWVSIFSPRCVEQIARIKATDRYIPAMLDFTTALTNGESNQSYNTPALTTIYLLEQQLEYFDKLGLNAVDKEQHEKIRVLNEWVESRPELSFYVSDPEARSMTVSTINIIDEIPYQDLTKSLRSQGIPRHRLLPKIGQESDSYILIPQCN